MNVPGAPAPSPEIDAQLNGIPSLEHMRYATVWRAAEIAIGQYNQDFPPLAGPMVMAGEVVSD
jgi:hypothetical protein